MTEEQQTWPFCIVISYHVYNTHKALQTPTDTIYMDMYVYLYEYRSRKKIVKKEYTEVSIRGLGCIYLPVSFWEFFSSSKQEEMRRPLSLTMFFSCLLYRFKYIEMSPCFPSSFSSLSGSFSLSLSLFLSLIPCRFGDSGVLECDSSERDL